MLYESVNTHEVDVSLKNIRLLQSKSIVKTSSENQSSKHCKSSYKYGSKIPWILLVKRAKS